MLDILNFKRKSYTLDSESNSLIVNLPLSISQFKNVVNSASTVEIGYKYLTYVANICHHGSPGNIMGLSKSEHVKMLKEQLGLHDKFKETTEIRLAIDFYNSTYNNGIFGLFKEMRRSFDMTRDGIESINLSLDAILKDIKKQQTAKTETPEVIMAKIKQAMEAISQVRSLTATLGSETGKLKEIEGMLLSEEESHEALYGGGHMPNSSIPS